MLESALYSMESVPLKIRKEHNKLLVDLCDLLDISAPSYKNFIGFLHNAALPGGRLQRVKDSPLDVFHLMEERGILKVGDYRTLEETLKASGNIQTWDLVKKVGSEITKQMKEEGFTTIDDVRNETEVSKKGMQQTQESEISIEPNQRVTSYPYKVKDMQSSAATEVIPFVECSKDPQARKQEHGQCWRLNVQEDRIVSDKELESISKCIGKEWEFLGRRLGISDIILEQIKEDFRYTRECIYQMLKEWKKLSAEKATISQLKSALQESDIVMDKENITKILSGTVCVSMLKQK